VRADDPTLELLSRHLDGDLDEAEERGLAARVEAEEELRLELEGLAQVAAALRRVAEAERPPAMLDTVLEPLVVGPMSVPGRRRPWARWAAAAAVAVLGVTVMLEVSERRSAGWPEEPLPQAARRSAPASGERERFALAPLPSREPDDEERPRGAVERLLADDEPAFAPADEVPPPLEVLGPLDVPVPATRHVAGLTPDPAPLEGDPGLAAPSAANATADLPPSDSARPPSSDDLGREGADSGKAGLRTAPGDSAPKGRRPGAVTAHGQLLVFVEGETAWRSFELRERCDFGRYAVRVRIEDGMVRRVWPVWKPLAAPTESLQASELVLGLEIDGVADGEYPAEVVVESGRARPQ
jgi:hypothetical protein